MTSYTPVPLGTDIQVNTTTAGDQRYSEVTALADGGFILTWSSNGQDGDGYGVYGQRYDSAGTPVGGEFLINTYTNEQQLYSNATALADGGFVITWSSSAQDGDQFGIFGQRYDAAGVPIGGEFQINSETASVQIYSGIAGLETGGFVITWASAGQDGNGFGIYGQRYDATGAAIGSEFRVNTETTGSQQVTNVTALNDGGFIVAWSSNGQDGSDWGVYGQRYDAAGAVVGSEFQINTYTTNSQTFSSVTALGDGGFLVTWSSFGQDGDGYGIYGQRYDAAGTTVGSEFQINTYTTNSQTYSSVTALGDGGFVVTWSSSSQDGDGWGIYGQRYDADGNVWGSEFRLNDITAGNQIGQSEYGSLTLDTLEDGRLVATWTGQGTEEVFVRLIDVPVDPTPQPIGDDIQVNTTTTGAQHFSEVTALNDGGFVVTWQSSGQDGSGWGIYGQRYDATGAAVGGEFQINTETGGDQSYSSTTALADGGFLVTWSSDGQDGDSYGIFGQRYDATGTLVGSEFQINTYTTSVQSFPSVTALADGGFVVTWSSNGQDGNSYGIYGQRYDAAGAAVGSEFQINTYTTSSQIWSSVTALADGGFVVTWSSFGQDGDGNGIYGQRYDAAGAVVGIEFRINTFTAANQTDSSVSALADGGFVVTWASFGQDGDGNGIYGQRYDAAGAAVGSEFQINTYTTSFQSFPSATLLADGGFVVSWSSDGQDGSGWGIFGQRYDATGTAVGREFRFNDITTGDQLGQSFYGSLTLDTLADGRLVATWTGEGTEEVFVRLIDVPLDPTPQPVGDDIQVNTTTTDQQRYSEVTALDDGGFVVTWSSLSQDGDNWGIYGQRYDASGAVVGSEFQINTYTTSAQLYSSTTALADGGFVVTWDSFGQDGDNYGIYGQRYGAAGAAVGSEFQINTYTTDAQVQSSVTALNDGGFVVTWSSLSQDSNSYGIYGQRYDATGTQVGSEFQINTYTTSAQQYSATTALNDGGFVVTWSSNGQDGDGYGIYGQRYDAAGSTVGGEFQINTETTSAQFYSSVTALADGGFVVTWSSLNQDSNSYGIYGQRYDATGTQVGSEFQINTYTTSSQLYSSTTALADGGFVVTWSSLGQDVSGWGIYGQRYSADGLAVGREFRLNDITAGQQIGDSFYGSLTLDTLADGRLVATWTGQGTEEVLVRIIDVPNDAPTLDNNTGSTVLEDGNDAILAVELDTNDAESADSLITYTLDSTVANGTLYLDLDSSGTFNAGDTELLASSTFTQDDINNGRLRYDHDGSETTTDSFQFDVTDSTVSIDDQTFDITVTPVNDIPTLDNNTGSTVLEDGSNAILAAELDTNDAESADSLITYSLDTTVANGTLYLDLDSSGTFNAGDTELVASSTFTQDDINNGRLRYDHDGNETTTDSFQFDVTDSTVSIDDQTFDITVTPVDDPAVAQDDAFATNESDAITGGNVLLANPTLPDSDVDSPLTITEVNGQAANVGVQIALPSGALLTLNANGTFDYDPNGAFDHVPAAIGSGASNLFATDSFTYQLNGDDTATVTITINGEDSAGDNLLGTVGTDILIGGIGADTMQAGLGNDFYYVDNAGDVVTEASGEGVDRVFTSVNYTLAAGSSIELFTTTARSGTASIQLTGNELDQIIQGNNGHNVLTSGGGEDSLQGFDGDDTYIVDSIGDDVVEAVGMGSDSVFASTTYRLGSQSEIEWLDVVDRNGTLAINLTGNQFNQNIYGNAGSNILNGGGGADILTGYAGNDFYYVDSTNDVVGEAVGEGFDRVFASTSYTLAAASEIELFTTTARNATTSIDLTGNEFSQTIQGNNGDNNLDAGGGGANALQGFDGDDNYTVHALGDRVYEGIGMGFDTVAASASYRLTNGAEIEQLSTTNQSGTGAINLTGNQFDQLIQGNAGTNYLNGNGGADTLQGFGGNDFYFVDSADDVVIEATGEGFDRVFTSLSYTLGTGVEVELFTTTWTPGTGAIDLTGNELDQTIQGNNGANVLTGGGGEDSLQGFGGDDTYFVDSIGDSVIDGSGMGTNDQVFASTSYQLGIFAEAEVLATQNVLGTDAINLTGNDFNQLIQGNAGSNILDGRSGADTLQGFAGNDFYYVDNVGDVVIEMVGEGFDRVFALTSYTLDAGAEVELFTTAARLGTTSMDLSGNELDQIIHGNNGANTINGGEGNDILSGFAGADFFRFDTALDANNNVDRIVDFTVGEDTIRLDDAIFSALTGLGALSAVEFTTNTSGMATTADQRVIYETDTGTLFYDADGNGAATAVSFATLNANLAITEADFMIV